MAEDLFQQAPAVGAGSLIGSGGLIAALRFFRMFASPQEVELAEARVKAECDRNYVTRESMKTVLDKLDYIQHRLDQLADRI